MPMFTAVLTVEFSLDGNDNLKGKRRVANSLKRLRLAVVSISNSETHLRSRMDKCALMMEAVCPERMTGSELEIYVVE